MSERKVLQKYYPPDFDPRDISRRRGPKTSGPRIQTVRLGAPFSMRCMTCGEYIGRGRRFNARKETDIENKYLNIQIFIFHIKCTRCSAEIIFQTDPKNNDYAMVKGALRNMQPWRNKEAENETIEERLDRLEREEAEAAGEEEKNAMADLEAKNADARRDMAAADALDSIQRRNARIYRAEKQGVDFVDSIVRTEDEELARQEREDEEAARQAFAAKRLEDVVEEDLGILGDEMSSPNGSQTLAKTGALAETTASQLDGARPVAEETTDHGPATKPVTTASSSDFSFKRVVKRKKDHAALLGIKKKPKLV
ncbi:hypothetical protein CDD81_7379 [Ophiocordyceps australis]|uniref:Splicing factor YJU2 n=1 Tax=Ophiocordyceps australis TaxID=1399860 RepID=A0A2C5XY48_9HYPO|nr:hypothetical protein CDD81_7379 [Ophiocordyceps australis]